MTLTKGKKILHIALDFGGSGVKVVCCYQGQFAGYLILPQVASIEVKKKYVDRDLALDITKSLWVETDGVTYALGRLAESTYMQPIPLVQPKKTYMIPRALGAIAVAAERFKINNFKVSMQVLLPAMEFDRDAKADLCEGLREAAKSFDSPIGEICCEIVKPFTAKPEGFGMQRRKMLVEGSLSLGAFVVVTMGHRQTNLYISEGGVESHYRSNSHGFTKAIEHSGIDPSRAISNPKLVPTESIDIYWAATASWLRENWPASATDAIIGGGPMAVVGERATDYVNNLLENNRSVRRTGTLVNGGMPITPYEEGLWKGREGIPELLRCWPDGIGIEIDQRQRFVDVYCFLVSQMLMGGKKK